MARGDLSMELKVNISEIKEMTSVKCCENRCVYNSGDGEGEDEKYGYCERKKISIGKLGVCKLLNCGGENV